MNQPAPVPPVATAAVPPDTTAALPPGRRSFPLLRVLAWPFRRGAGALGYLIRHPGRSLVVGALGALVVTGGGLAVVSSWALYHFQAAHAALERYHGPEAYRHVHLCLMVWPRDRVALLMAARAAYRVQHYPEAEQYLDQYQAAHGKDDELFLERVLLRAAEGRVDEVGKYCRDRVEKDDPNAPLLLEALIRGYLLTYRLQDADFCAKQWQERQPDEPEVVFLQGRVFEEQSRLRDAVGCYRQVLERDPEHDEARLRLVTLLVDMAQPAEEVLPQLEYLRRRQPYNLLLDVYLARCQDQLGHPAEAQQLLDGVLAQDPHVADALSERGKLALRNGQPVEAEKYLRQASQLQPGDAQVHYQLYQALMQSGKEQEARAVQVRLKQIVEDVARLQTLMNVQLPRAPHDPDLEYQAGMIAMRAGQVQNALRWFQSALRDSDQKHAPTHRALAEYYQKIGERGRATRHLEEARQAAPPAP